eukprot:GHVS01014869.1.p1 GENE.GHVS01014869.1~~GHVS01014869.1.p1  ORF type:complete len:212 (+),score=12.02 GHVS01014869.1:423-1058(+)
MDEKVLSDFVRQGIDNYSRYRNYLHLHNAIFGINTKLGVTGDKFEVVKHGIMSLKWTDMHVSTVTSAEAGEEDIMEIFIELGLDGDKQFIYGFTYKLHVNTSEITPNCTLTSDEKRDIKSSGLDVKRKMDAFFENVCNTAVEDGRLDSAILTSKTFPSRTRHGRMPRSVTCTVAIMESSPAGTKTIGFWVNYPKPNEDLTIVYEHVIVFGE